METIKVRYETEIITGNAVIVQKGFSSLCLRNLGDDDSTILNNIPIKAHEVGSAYYDEFILINRPGEVIAQNIPVKFAGAAADQRLLVIKTYYE
jgi:hypothetical protein